MLRLDLIDPEISGNKWFKLQHNLNKAIAGNFDTIITFGGAFSNHIAATAAACKRYQLKAIAIIRGEEQLPLNTTLAKARENGMQLHFVSRQLYSQKTSEAFNAYLLNNFGRHYLIPEGGNNAAGIIGCKDIVKQQWDYDYILCACGTGTTFAGLVAAAKPGQTVIGISVLKGENKLPQETADMLRVAGITIDLQQSISGNEALEQPFINRHCIINTYCFSGYAKCDKQLLDFKNNFEAAHNLPLDHVYTAKLFYAVTDLLKQQKLKPGSGILVVHSGGLQGNKGFEERYALGKASV